MTATTVKSTRIANDLDLALRVVEPAGIDKGQLRVSVDTIEAATTSLDEANDVILMLPLPSCARLHSLVIFNDDLDSHGTPALAVNVGLANGPEKFVDSAATSYAAYGALDVDCFASAISTLQSANTAGVEIRFEAGGTYDEIAKIGKRLWEVVNLPEDPNKHFVVSLKVSTQAATAVAGTISLRAIWSV